ncbi:hypothetical protein NFI96_015798 [Prochilodus magdalenae]|nr:hypothetical protein NFI96_015798 [Prochilodus magdalenae]
MPRQARKGILLNPQKSQLAFVEQPQNGPRHDYGQQLRSAINPRSFVSEASRQSIAVSSWVSPQFTSYENTTVGRGGRGRRKKNQLPTNTINTTSILSLPQVKRGAASKYSALEFETTASVPQRWHKALSKQTASCVGETQKAQSVRHCKGDGQKNISPNIQNEVPREGPRQRPVTAIQQTTATSKATITPLRTTEIVKTPLALASGKQRTAGSAHTQISGKYTPNTSTDFISPPHIETPEMSHNEQSCHSSSIVHFLFSPRQQKSPPRTESFGLLVKDTPEKDYGLKVTWRRRKKLMKLLTDQGHLLIREAMVSNQ